MIKYKKEEMLGVYFMNIAMDDIFLFFLITSIVGVVYYFPRDRQKRNTLILVSILSFILFGVAHNAEDEARKKEIEQTETVKKSEMHKEKHKHQDEDSEEVKQDPVYETFEFNQEIENNEEVEVNLIKIEKLEDEVKNRDRIEATFEIKNKTDRTVQLRAKAVSINDYMINSDLYYMRAEIASGKSAISVLTIEDYQDQYEVPNLEGNFEMALDFFDWDDLYYQTMVDVKVELE